MQEAREYHSTLLGLVSGNHVAEEERILTMLVQEAARSQVDEACHS